MSSDAAPSFVAIAHDFPRHPKLLRLGTPRDRWIWLGVLCYTVEYRTEGVVPKEVADVVRGATPAFLERCFRAGLLENIDQKLVVHDFDEFNGSKRERLLARERKRRQRELDREEQRELDREDESRSGHVSVTPRGRAFHLHYQDQNRKAVKAKAAPADVERALDALTPTSWEILDREDEWTDAAEEAGLRWARAEVALDSSNVSQTPS